MKGKKHLGIVIISSYIVVMITLVYFSDKRIYGKVHNLINEEEVNVTSFTYTNDKGDVIVDIEASENATYIEVNNVGYVVDNNELFAILSKYKCKKSKNKYFPCSQEDIVVEISITQNNKPKHIVLGNFYIWYESADKRAYDIIDGYKLLEEILALPTIPCH